MTKAEAKRLHPELSDEDALALARRETGKAVAARMQGKRGPGGKFAPDHAARAAEAPAGPEPDTPAPDAEPGDAELAVDDAVNNAPPPAPNEPKPDAKADREPGPKRREPKRRRATKPGNGGAAVVGVLAALLLAAGLRGRAAPRAANPGTDPGPAPDPWLNPDGTMKRWRLEDATRGR